MTMRVRVIRKIAEIRLLMDFTEAYPDRCSTVGSAVQAGDIEALKELIGSGASINVYDNRGWTPLHEAAHANQCGCVRILLSKTTKEDVNAQTWEGETALFFAARSGHEKILKQLMKHDGNPNICNNEEGSPILQAVAGNHEECVAFLIKKGADVNSKHFSGWSLLHEAACHGFSGVLQLLLRTGANTDVRDDFGIAPVFTAAQYGHLDCLKLLILYGTDPNSRAEDDATPLYLAAQEGHTGCVKFLLSHGALTDIPTDTEDRFRPIHAAAFKGHIRCLELLLPRSLSVLEMASLPDELKRTPLHLASMGGHKQAVRMLLEAGCDPDCGVRNPSKEIKEFLLNNAQTSEENAPPFYCATERGHLATAKILLYSGACICQPSSNYCLLTVSDRDTRALRLLIDHGADVSCKHVFESPSFLITCDIEYLKCLVNRGLRICFNCQYQHSLCPKICCGHYFDLNRLKKQIQLMYRYVDRLDLCEHSIMYLQERSSYFYDSLRSKPRSLFHLSRVAITEHIGTTRAPQVIPGMDFLPTLLKDYLLYRDVYPD